LGTLGGLHGTGYAINAAGQVAGTSVLAGDVTDRAFLYTGTPGVNGQMIDLDAWLDTNNPSEGAKWELLAAYGLSDTGLVTGVGLYDDGFDTSRRAFLLDGSALVVPEPASIALLGLAMPVVLRRRARQTKKSGR